MDVILMERVENLGLMGDVVTVKDGYARNYLLPQLKALRATEENREKFEHQRVELEARNIERRGEAESVGDRLDGLYTILIRQSSDTGQLFGSVSARDIANAVTEAGFNLERKQIFLDRSIKTLGIHPVRVSLHPEIIVSVNVNVARSDLEAEQQEEAFRSSVLPAGASSIAQTESEIEIAETDSGESEPVAAEEFFEDTALVPSDEPEEGAEPIAEAEVTAADKPSEAEPADEESSASDAESEKT